MQTLADATVLIPGPFQLGEGPIWHPHHQRLYFVDIIPGRVHSCLHDGSDLQTHIEGPQVGGFTIQSDSRLLVFRERDIILLDPTSNTQEPVTTIDNPDASRFNDVIACPDGSVLAGTIGASHTSGGLYHLKHDLSLTQLYTATHVANGMAFTPDATAFYFTDSSARTILRFPWHNASGPGAPEPYIALTDQDQGTPDGLTIDNHHTLYSVRWDGHGVYLYQHTDCTAHIPVNTPRTTAATIGGPNLDTLYITTSQSGLFTTKVNAPHRPEFRTTIQPASPNGSKKQTTATS